MAKRKNFGKTSLGLDENVEALLSYVLVWITGIIFLVLENKSKFVRFHAMQSTITFLGLTIVNYVVFWIPFFGWMIGGLISLLAFITWVVCIIKAYQGEKFKLPVIGDIAESQIK